MRRKPGPLDDFGGAKELANYRLSIAKEDLADADAILKKIGTEAQIIGHTMPSFAQYPLVLRWSSKRSRAMRR